MRQVRRPWMRKHGLQGYLCRIVKVTGESMEPTLPDGASILAPGGRDSMRTLRVTPHAEQIELGVTRRLYDFSAIGPQDLSVNHANSLGDASCTCRLFGGVASVVLHADTLKLSFANVTRDAYGVVFEAIRQCSEFLATEFPENGVAWLSLHSSQDVAASDGAPVDTYLSQFAHEGAVAQPQNRNRESAAEQEPGIMYRPSICVTLTEQGRHWELRRSVEQSASTAGGLFVTTSVFIPESEVEAFGGLEQVVARLYGMADRAVGLHRGDG